MMTQETPEEQLAYERFVIENYYGGDSEPITPEFFKEIWDEMSEVNRAELIKRAKGEVTNGNQEAEA